MVWCFRVRALTMLLLAATFSCLEAQRVEPIHLDGTDDGQYAFADSVLDQVEVVSLAESIHITHEFPLARLGIVRRIHETAGFDVLAFEGSPEDLWVSQDTFMQEPGNLTDSTSGLFGIWNTDEMRSVFAYERTTWLTSHPLYITAYDIQPGTGKSSSGASVFALLQQHLSHYAAPPANFDVTAWEAALSPLASACSTYKSTDEDRAVQAIDVLARWIDTVMPRINSAYPGQPMHAEALHLIPQSLRSSLALCKVVGAPQNRQRDWATYKQTRDRLAAEYALTLKSASPNQRLMLWAHVSHLFYDSGGRNTSVGELLHQALGPRLYTIGTFALGGGTIVIFSDVNEDVGYSRISGISSGLNSFLAPRCSEVCFSDLRHLPRGSALSGSQRLWMESRPETIPLADDFDGAIWVTHVHTAHLRFPLFLVLSGKHYLKALVSCAACLGTTFLCWCVYRLRRRMFGAGAYRRVGVLSSQSNVGLPGSALGSGSRQERRQSLEARRLQGLTYVRKKRLQKLRFCVAVGNLLRVCAGK